MRILVIANIPPFVKGGAETQARLLAEEFIALGHSVTVAGHEIPDKKLSDDYLFDATHISTFRATKFTRGVSYFFSLAWLIFRNRNKFDVIYCRFLGETALSVCLVKHILKLDIALIPCTACAGRMGDAEYIKQFPFQKYLINLINRQCSAINNISPEIGNELTSLGVNPRLLNFLPNGIRINNVKPKKSISTIRKLVYLGRLTPQKAIPYLLDAVNLLTSRGEKLELYIIGDGPDREKLEEYTQLSHLSEYVYFCDHIDNKLIVEHLSSYDIFVLPSLYEGFATATIEAMLAGLPAVVTISGGPNYFVDDSVGRLCQPGDAKSLATALSELIRMNDTELLEMGARGQQRVIDKFNIKTIAKDYIKLFNQLVNKA